MCGTTAKVSGNYFSAVRTKTTPDSSRQWQVWGYEHAVVIPLALKPVCVPERVCMRTLRWHASLQGDSGSTGHTIRRCWSLYDTQKQLPPLNKYVKLSVTLSPSPDARRLRWGSWSLNGPLRIVKSADENKINYCKAINGGPLRHVHANCEWTGGRPEDECVRQNKVV